MLYSDSNTDISTLTSDIVSKAEIRPTIVDERSNSLFVLRWRNWKLLTGNYVVEGWGPTYKCKAAQDAHSSADTTLLFDLDTDPREETNLKDRYPDILARFALSNISVYKTLELQNIRLFGNDCRTLINSRTI